MIRQQTEELLELYKLYGFECVDQRKEYLVLIYTSGYFNNVEIVQLVEDFSCEDIQAQYKSLGYSVRVVQFSSVDETHNNLFVGFFNEKGSSGIAFPISKLLEIDIQLMHSLTHDYNDVYCDAILFPASFDFNGSLRWLCPRLIRHRSAKTAIKKQRLWQNGVVLSVD